MDFDEDVPSVVPLPKQSTGPDTESWRGYPQSSFPNWTESQVKRCEMLTACPVGESNVFKVDVLDAGTFNEKGPKVATINDRQTEINFWNWLKSPVSPLVCCPINVENNNGVAEGTRYSIASPFRSEYDQRSSANVGGQVCPSFL